MSWNGFHSRSSCLPSFSAGLFLQFLWYFVHPFFFSSLAKVSLHTCSRCVKGRKLFSVKTGIKKRWCSQSPKCSYHRWLRQERYWSGRGQQKYKLWLLKFSRASFSSCCFLQTTRLLLVHFLSFSLLNQEKAFLFPCNLLVLLWSALSSDQRPCSGGLLLSYHMLGIHFW